MKLKETLSALLDGEAGKIDQLELRRLARAIEDRPELLESYRRYTLTQAVLRGEPVNLQDNVFLGRVRRALADAMMEEPVQIDVASNASPARFRWLPAAGRVAVAASVAFVAIYLVQWRTPVPSVPAAPASTAVAIAVPPVRSDLTSNTRMVNPDVLTVSAGERPDAHNTEAASVSPVACAISAPRPDTTGQVWEKALPPGYVLCKQNSSTGQCESYSRVVSCYQN